MSRHDPIVTLRQMLEHAQEASDLAAGRFRADLERDRLLYLALTRLLEIVGEAANRLLTDWRQRLPGIPWAQVASLRNRLAHGYDEVDLNILWEIVVDDLPPLIDAQEEALRDPAP